MLFSPFRQNGWTLLALLIFTGCSALSNRIGQPARTPWTYVVPKPSPTIVLVTHGVAPSPEPAPSSVLGKREAERYRLLVAQVQHCKHPQAGMIIDRTLYIACADGPLVALDRNKRVVASTNVHMSGVDSIVPAGRDAIAMIGYNYGSITSAGLILLRARTLRPIAALKTDSTLLGVIGDRAYIDNWCCFVSSDVYQPATIYSISLKTGAESTHVDLAPDPQAHPPDQLPVGQGEHNYLIGKYFYVVVGPITYRYDVFHLQKQPKRMGTSHAFDQKPF